MGPIKSLSSLMHDRTAHGAGCTDDPNSSVIPLSFPDAPSLSFALDWKDLASKLSTRCCSHNLRVTISTKANSQV